MTGRIFMIEKFLGLAFRLSAVAAAAGLAAACFENPGAESPSASRALRAKTSPAAAPANNLRMFSAPDAAPQHPASPGTPQPALRLRGVVAASTGGQGWAVIETGGRQMLLRPGDTVDGLRLESVDEAGVELAGRISRLTLTLDRGLCAPAAQHKSSPLAVPAAAVPFEQKGSDSWEIDRPSALGLVAKISLLARSAKVIPFYRSGQSCGFMIFQIEKGSLFESLGLRDGDVITHLNGAPLSRATTPDHIAEIVKSSRLIQILVDRNRSVQSLSYRLR